MPESRSDQTWRLSVGVCQFDHDPHAMAGFSDAASEHVADAEIGAYASHEESIKGSITTSRLADFVVLADDPHTVDPDKIKDIDVVRTVTGGNTVHQA